MSMKASGCLSQDGAGRRIAVLGDMGELENEVSDEEVEHAQPENVILMFLSVQVNCVQISRRGESHGQIRT